MKKFAVFAVILAVVAVATVGGFAYAQSRAEIPVAGLITSATGEPVINPDIVYSPPGSAHPNLEEYLDDISVNQGPQGNYDLGLYRCSDGSVADGFTQPDAIPTGTYVIRSDESIHPNIPPGWFTTQQDCGDTAADDGTIRISWATEAPIDPVLWEHGAIPLNFGPVHRSGGTGPPGPPGPEGPAGPAGEDASLSLIHI